MAGFRSVLHSGHTPTLTGTMAFGYFFVHSYDDLLKMALLLGVAGASFGVAMSLGSGWYPPKYKGRAMVFGGWISDHWGCVNTLTVVLVVVAVALVGVGLSSQSVVLTTLLLIVCFAALGAGNGALFQLVPMLMGQSQQHTDSFLTGFVVLAVFSVPMLGVMRKMQVRWTRTWAEKGGRARTA